MSTDTSTKTSTITSTEPFASEPVIRYDHVDISYNGKKAVSDLSLSAAPGEILGIAGESGSGKSSLLKAACGILGSRGMVTAGEISYQGRNLLELPAKELRKICGKEIGMIFQYAGTSFMPIRTIRSQLLETMQEHEKTTAHEFEDKAQSLLNKFGFEDPRRILDSYPFELSGGMQQRVGIAAAMLLEPRVLLADEPTSALDVIIQKQVIEEMLMVRETFGTTILLVTHNLGVIRSMADRVMIMKDGCMVEEGSTEEILTAPKAEYTRRLVASVPRLRRSK